MKVTCLGVLLLSLPVLCNAQNVPAAAQGVSGRHTITSQVPGTKIDRKDRDSEELQALLSRQTEAIKLLISEVADLEERMKALEEKTGKRDGR